METEQSADKHETYRNAPSARAGLAALSLAMLLSSLGTSIANVSLPVLAQGFSASFQQVQWVVLAYLLAITTLIISVGRLGDLIGKRRLLLVGIALFSTSSLICGAAPALGVLIAARAAQGLGAAIMMALAMAMVGDTVPKEKLGRAMGQLGAMSAVGTALGPSLGGVLISSFGWRAIFFVNVPLSLIAFALAQRGLAHDRAPSAISRTGFDIPGTVLLALSLAAYALAMTLGKEHFGTLSIALLVSAGIGTVLFMCIEARAKAPLVQLHLLRDSMLRTSLALSACVSTVMMTTLVVGPFYLAQALGLAPATVGIVMSVGPLVVAISGAPAGRMADRFGTRAITLTGLSGIAMGCLCMAATPASAGIPGYLFPIIILTAGYALFQTANNTAVMKDISPGQRGVISGLLNLSRNLGLITGAAAMGSVFALTTGYSNITTAPPTAIATATRSTFAIAAAMILIALHLCRIPSNPPATSTRPPTSAKIPPAGGVA